MGAERLLHGVIINPNGVGKWLFPIVNIRLPIIGFVNRRMSRKSG
jgi:hypothetical protein